MGSASECWARGRSFSRDALNLIRENQWVRWLLVPPIVFFGSAVASWAADSYGDYVAGWAGDDRVELSGPPESILPFFAPIFIHDYTWVVLTAIAAPRAKKSTAIVSAGLYCVLFSGASQWLLRSNRDWNYWPLFSWLVFSPLLLGGFVLALVLVFRRVRPRMMLTLPAYYVGFSVPAWGVGVTVGLMLSHWHFDYYGGFYEHYRDLLENALNFIGGFGAIGLVAVTSRFHSVRTAIIFLLLTLAYSANSWALHFTLADYPFLAGMDIPGSSQLGLILGALAALGLVILRGKKASLPVPPLRDPGNK